CCYTTYGIKDCTDGLSNTIIYAESLVGDASRIIAKFRRNNGVTSVNAAGAYDAIDASSQPWNTFMLPAIQACSAAFQAGTPYVNIINSGGCRWGFGGVGPTLFNTVITPNSKQAQWNSCANVNAGGNIGDYALFSNCQSYPPGGANVLMSDGSC